MKRTYLICVFLMSTFYSAIAQENYLLKTYVKGLTSFQFSKNSKTLNENTIHNRFDFDWYASSKLTITAGLRNRLIFGDIFSEVPNYSSTLGEDIGYFNLTTKWLDKNNSVGISQLDRFFADYTIGKLEITLGRQRINWGQAFVWNPNDLFNTYSFFDFDYEEKPGSDAVRLQYYIGEASKIEWASVINNNKKITSALLYKVNTHNYDLQFLTGIYSQTDWVFGTGWSGSIKGGGFNGELTYFHSILASTSKKNYLTAVIHYDYTFKSSLNLQFETLYNGFGTSTSGGLSNFEMGNLNPKNLFPTKTAFFCSGSYNVSPLFNLLLAGMYSANGNFLYLGPTFTYSLSDNKQLSLIGQYFSTDENTPQNSIITSNGGALFMRLKWAF